MLKSFFKRLLTITLVMMFLFGFVPAIHIDGDGSVSADLGSSPLDRVAYAEGVVTPTGSLTINNSGLLGITGSNTNSADNGSISLSGAIITVTAKGYATGGCNSADKSSTTTVTFKNNSPVEMTVACSKDGGTLSSNSPIVLNAGSTFTFAVTSGEGTSSSVTQKLTISSIELEAVVVTTTFASAANGSYTVTYNGQPRTVGQSYNESSDYPYILSATPASGYEFKYWVNGSGEIVSSTQTNFSYTATSDATIKPVFYKSGSAVFALKTNLSKPYGYLDEAITAAGSSGTIVVIGNGSVYGSTGQTSFTIPSGVTLLVPNNSNNTLMTTKPTASTGTSWSGTPSAFRTLTLKNGTKLLVNGAVSVGANVNANNYGYVGAPIGTYGYVKLESGSSITLNSGSNLYSWGYVSGGGTVTANSGSTIYEPFIIGYYRGGSRTSALAGNDYKVFPFSQYFFQNVESELILKYGASLKTVTGFQASSGGSIQQNTVNAIGNSGAMFTMSSGSTIRRWYATAEDKIHYEVTGEVALNPISLTVYVSINSLDYVLPLMQNMVFELKGTLNVNQEVHTIPGFEMTIDEGAEMIINSDTTNSTPKRRGFGVYLYNRVDWKGANNDNYYPQGGKHFVALQYSPTRSKTFADADLKDTYLNVNGKITVKGYGSYGGLYTTGTTSNIVSSAGTGRIEFVNGPGTKTLSYQCKNNTAEYGEDPIVSARLKNGDGTYTETAGSAAGTTFIYCGTCDKWVTEPHSHDSKPTPVGTDFTVTDNTYTYDGSAKTATVNGQDGMGEITVSYWQDGIQVTNPTDAGTYTIMVSVAENESYNAVSDLVVGTLTINKADSSAVAPDAKTPTYTGSAQALVTAGTAVGGTMQYSLERDGTYSTAIPTGVNAGGYTVWYKVVGDANHNDTATASVNVTIAPKPVTVTEIVANNKIYDGTVTATLETETATINGKVGSDGLQVVATGAFDDANVGNSKTVTITYTGLTGSSASNYELNTADSWASTTANITPATVTVTADAKTKAYGEADPALTCTADGLIGSDTLTGALSRESGEDVGEYEITQGTLTAGGNYTIAFTGAKLTITAATMTVTAEDYTGTYDGNSHSITVTAPEGAAVTYSTSEDGEYSANNLAYTNAGTYTVYYKVEKANYITVNGSAAVIISKAAQAAPTGLTATAETYSAQGNGTISGVEQHMEYGTSEEGPFIEINSTTINGLAAGTYYVRYRGDANHYASPCTMVTVAAGRKIVITWNNYDGTFITTTEVDFGETPEYTGATPTKPATAQYTYTFAGWTPGIAAVTEDKTYTAVFDATVNKYTITWVDGNGDTLKTEQITYGDTPAYTGETPTKTATAQYTYTFNNTWNPAIVAVTGNATYTAQFDSTVNKYTITWVDGNGNTLKTEQVAYGETPAYTGATPTKTATAQYTYTFNNTWNPEITAVTGDATYTAQFESVVNEYTITWVDGNGNTLKTEQVAYGETPAYTGDTPTKTATAQYTYTFAGWTPEIVAVTGDATYTAQFESVVNEYTITWVDGNGNTLKTEQVAYGEIPAYTGETPTKAATAQYTYTFNNTWNPEITAVTGDATYTAQFDSTVRTYTITFVDEDGTELQSGEFEYGVTPAYTGATPTKPADAQYTYVFAGWDPEITAVTGTATYTATYTGNENVARIGEVMYTSLADAIAAVKNGETIVLLQDSATADAENGKAFTIDMNGHTLTGITWVDEDTTLTIDGTAEGSAYNGSIYVGYSTNNNGNVVLNGGTYTCESGATVLHINGTCLNSDVTIKNAVITSPDDNGIQLNGSGTFVIENSTITGATGVYVKSGNLKIKNSTIIGNMAEANYNYNGNGAYATGDAIVIDSCEYPGGAPVVMIGEGNTFNGTKKQIGYYEYDGNHDGATEAAEITATTNELTIPEGYAWTEAGEGLYRLVKAFTIRFVDEDGTELQSSEVAYGETPVYNGEEPTKDATAQYTYTFSGWTPEVVSVTGDATYTATYTETVNKYTIKFVNEDGTVLQSSEVAYGETPAYTGETPTKPATAEHTFYFDGWDPAPVQVTCDATYTAKYSTVLNTYTVTWKNEDGTVLETDENVTYGEMPAYNGETPTKAATAQYTYTFASWTPEIAAVTGDATYTATYAETVNNYTVTFKNWDGEVLQEGSVAYGSIPAYNGETPTKAADAQYTYTFSDWTPEVVSVTGDATYTATYTATVNKYTIRFVNEGGTVLQSGEVAYGEMPAYTGATPTKPATAQYTYTFAGWDPKIAAVTGDAIYTAQFDSTVNKYTIKFVDEDGTELQSGEVEYGETPVYNGEEPTKAATAQYTYSFAGWTPEIAAVTGEATYTAKFDSTVNRYTVTVETDGNGTATASTNEADYGTEITVNAETSFAGYVFDNWTINGEVVSTDNPYTFTLTGGVTLKANFKLSFDPVAKIGNNYYETLDDAVATASSGDTIVLLKDWTQENDVTIPSGVTLLLPYAAGGETINPSDAQHPFANEAIVNTMQVANVGTNTNVVLTMAAGKKLTVETGAELVVGGTLGGYHPIAGATVGKHSEINLGEDASIEVASGAILSNCGYISGGTVNVYGTAYEPFVVTDYHGGTVLFSRVTSHSSPFNSYVIMNTRSDMILDHTAELHGYVMISAGGEQQRASIKAVGSNGLFVLDSGKLTISYSETDTQTVSGTSIGKTKFEFDGSVSFDPITLEYGGYSINMQDVIFAIPYSIEMTQKSGTFTVNADAVILPGSAVTIAEGASAVIANGHKLFVADVFTPNNEGGMATYPAGLNGQRGNLFIDGTLTIENGATFGGVVQTHGTGKIVVGEDATLNGTFSAGGGANVSNWPVTARAAMLYAEGNNLFEMNDYSGEPITYYGVSGTEVAVEDQAPVTGTWGIDLEITLIANYDGADPVDLEARVGVEKVLPTDTFTREGYTFAGWTEDEAGAGDKLTSYTMTMDSSGVLYAQWTANKYTVTVETDGNGTVTASATEADYGTQITVTATPDYAGYEFEKWTVNGEVISTDNPYTFTLTGDVTLKANFKLGIDPVAKIGNNYYATLDEAVTASKSGDIIVLLKNWTQENDVTIPSGVTLLLPYAPGEETINPNDPSDLTKHPYANEHIPETAQCGISNPGDDVNVMLTMAGDKKLTIESGAMLVVGGSLTGNQPITGTTYGSHSEINLGENASIEVANGAILSNCGYITGGKINAHGFVYEPFVMTDFHGGTVLMSRLQSGTTPFNSFALLNIQSDLVIYDDGALQGYAMVNSGNTQYCASALTIGSTDDGTGLFVLDEGTVMTISYDAKNTVDTYGFRIGKTTFTVEGDVTFTPMTISLMGQTLSTDMVTFGIPYNIDMVQKSGCFTVTSKAAILPGSTITVNEGASARLGDKSILLVLDKFAPNDEGGKPTYPKALTGERGNLFIDGTLTIENGATFGGVVQTHGTGKIVVGEDATLYGTFSAGGGDNKTNWPVTARVAMLHEEGNKLYEMGELAGDVVTYYGINDTTVAVEDQAPVTGTWGIDLEITLIANYDGAVPVVLEARVGVEKVLPTDTFTREGYTFAGWTEDKAGTGDKLTSYTMTMDSSGELYAQWTANKYTIKFVNEDGTELQSSEVAYGEMPAYTGATPTKAATAQYTYTFAGWTPKIAAVTGEATYTATYTEAVNKYTIKFVDDDGTELQSGEVEYGATPKYTGETPEKAATAQYTYTFSGWTPEIESVTGDATYTATYTATVNKYTIKFVDEDGTELQSIEVEYGATPVYTGETPTKEATAQYTYTFAGWDPKIVPVTGDATYTAQFDSTVNKYTITWVDGNGDTLKTEQVAYGETPAYTGETPTKDATAQYTYTFVGWTPEIVAVTGNATYTAQFESTVNEYTITWVDGNGNTLKTEQVDYGETPAYTGETPTKAATAQYTYTFNNTWSPEIVAVTGDATYTAQFDSTVNKYTIKFVDEDGTELQSGEVEYGATPVYNGEDPTKPATDTAVFAFSGWSPAVVPVTGDATYTAVFTSSDRLYTVMWLDEDGTKLADDQTGVQFNAELTFPGEADPTKPATAQYTYTFAGWTRTVDGNVITMTATYTATVNKYMITFVNEDGTELQSGEVEYGETPAYTGETPAKAADAQYTYTFFGWTPEVVSVTGDATYTATYTEMVNKYTIRFVDDDGTELQSSEVEYGETPEYTGETPTKPATAQNTYTFAGWTPEITEVTGEATYTATYSSTVNKYTIKFVDDDGTELQSIEVEYGATPVYTGETPTKEATAQYTYTFAGWTPTIAAVTGGATYTATYSSTVNKYTIEFVNEDGTVLQSREVAYGETPAYTGETPEKAATAQYTYTFAGWTPEIESVTGDATYTATYSSTVNTYTVIWKNWDGTVLETDENVPYGTAPSYDGVDPVKALSPDESGSYTFIGWDPELSDGAVVTGNLEFTAVFSFTGWRTSANGKQYFIDDEMQTGWLELDGMSYYLDEDTGYAATGLTEIPASEGHAAGKYLFSDDGEFLDEYNGVYSDEKTGSIYMIEAGVAAEYSGLYRDPTTQEYYFFVNNTAIKDQDAVITSANNNGAENELGDTLPDGTYFFGSDGVIAHEDVALDGIQSIDDVKYYYIDGIRVYMGMFEQDGYYYYADSHGKLVVGQTYWCTRNNDTGFAEGPYSFDSEGRLIIVPAKNGLYEEENELFYYEDGTRTFAGLIHVDAAHPLTIHNADGTTEPAADGYYYVMSNGQLVRNRFFWIAKTNDTGFEPGVYFFDEDGLLQIAEPKNGIYCEEGSLFYYENGARVGKGLIKIEADSVLYVLADGTETKAAAGYYYILSGGEVVHGRSYYVTNVNDTGVAAGTYTFGADGVMIINVKNGIYEEDGKKYYYENGVRTFGGLLLIDGSYYYAKNDGEIVCGKSYYVSKTNGLMAAGIYKFDSEGRMVINP